MTIKKARSMTSYCLALALTFCVLALPTPSHADGATVTRIPISTTFFVSCANESVDLSGELHLVSQSTSNANGGFAGHFISHSSALQGSGQSSGLQYIGHSRTNSVSVSSSDGQPFTSSFIFVFRVHGPGQDNDFTLRVHSHVTINANGEVTATVSSLEFTCD